MRFKIMKKMNILLTVILMVILALLSSGCTGHSDEDYQERLAEFAANVNASAEYYDQVVESDPENATAWCVRAMYYNGNFNQYEKALESVNRSLELDPESALAWYVKGIILLNSGDKDGASVYFDKAVKYDPSLAGSVPDVDKFGSEGTDFIVVAYKEE
jgi:tetratricopeptide (TPR) repeat protein